MYTSSELNKKNKNIRHLGNRESLALDIEKFISFDKDILDNQIDMHLNQTMHDIMLLIAISRTGSGHKLIHLGN